MHNLDKLSKLITQLGFDVKRMEDIDWKGYSNQEKANYFDSIAKQAEGLAIEARKLPEGFSDLEYILKQLNGSTMDPDAPISFVELPNGVELITMERILPKALRNGDAKKYLVSQYDRYIREHYKNNARRFRFTDERLVFLFVHYCEKRKELFQRDYDNMETKIIIDMLTAYLVTDDSPVNIDKYSMCMSGKDRTEIYILKVNHFYSLIGKAANCVAENEKMTSEMLIRLIKEGSDGLECTV